MSKIKRKKIGHMFYRETYDDREEYVYHTTAVMTLFNDNTMKICSNGWRSVTTKKHINQYLPFGFIRQVKGWWYFVVDNKEIPFEKVENERISQDKGTFRFMAAFNNAQ